MTLTFRPIPSQRPLQTEGADKRAREPEHNDHMNVSEQGFQKEEIKTDIPVIPDCQTGTSLINRTITLHVKLEAHYLLARTEWKTQSSLS